VSSTLIPTARTERIKLVATQTNTETNVIALINALLSSPTRPSPSSNRNFVKPSIGCNIAGDDADEGFESVVKEIEASEAGEDEVNARAHATISINALLTW
jgi:hypothetical protein